MKHVKEIINDINFFIRDVSIIVIKLKTKNINYFDLIIEKKEDIINVKKYIIYKDVYEFKKRIDIYLIQ